MKEIRVKINPKYLGDLLELPDFKLVAQYCSTKDLGKDISDTEWGSIDYGDIKLIFEYIPYKKNKEEGEDE